MYCYAVRGGKLGGDLVWLAVYSRHLEVGDARAGGAILDSEEGLDVEVQLMLQLLVLNHALYVQARKYLCIDSPIQVHFPLLFPAISYHSDLCYGLALFPAVSIPRISASVQPKLSYLRSPSSPFDNYTSPSKITGLNTFQPSAVLQSTIFSAVVNYLKEF